MKETIIKEALALEEIKEIHNTIYNTGDILDKKIFSILSNSSLILTLFGVMQLTLVTKEQPLIYKIGIVISVCLFLVLIVVVLMSIAPKEYKLVFRATKDGVNKAILHKKLPSAYHQLIVNYLSRIKHNKELNRKKYKSLNLATILYSIIVALLVILSLFATR